MGLLVLAWLVLASSSAIAAVTPIGGPGTGSGTFAAPGAVATDSNGNVFVLDPVRNTVLKFTNTGTFVTEAQGLALSEPSGIAVDAAGNVYVADPGNDNVIELSNTLTSPTTFTSGSEFVSVATGPGATIYALDMTGGGQYELQDLNSSGTVVNSMTYPNGTGTGDLAAPNMMFHDQVTVDPQTGDVYVTDAGNGRVEEFDGTTLAAVDGSFASGFTGIPLSIATGVVGGQTQVYVGDDGGGSAMGTSVIRHFGASGTLLGSLQVAGDASGGLATDAQGNVFDGSGTVGGSVLRIDTTPDPTVVATPAFGAPGEPVTFSGASSEIDLWSAADYTWTIAGTTTDTAATPTISHSFTAAGVYPVQLTLTGTNGRSADITVDYTVPPLAGSAAPPDFAHFTHPRQALTGRAVTFNAGSSVAPGFTITNYSWDFDDSGSYADSGGTSPAIKHTFKTPGTYQIQLRATRASGVVSTATGSIVVAPAPPRGRVGVRINGGDFATDSTGVKLALVWPAYATEAVISNTGYGRSATRIDLARDEPWTVRTGGARLKRVYVRFTGPYIRTRNVRAQIVVDRKPPTLTGAGLIGQAPGTDTYSVEIQASDPIAGICEAQSGSDTVSIANCKDKGIASLTQVVQFNASAPPQLVRVRNSAGVWSAREPIQQTAVGLPVPHRKIGG